MVEKIVKDICKAANGSLYGSHCTLKNGDKLTFQPNLEQAGEFSVKLKERENITIEFVNHSSVRYEWASLDEREVVLGGDDGSKIVFSDRIKEIWNDGFA